VFSFRGFGSCESFVIFLKMTPRSDALSLPHALQPRSLDQHNEY
jgi:hypothetical protein